MQQIGFVCPLNVYFLPPNFVNKTINETRNSNIPKNSHNLLIKVKVILMSAGKVDLSNAFNLAHSVTSNDLGNLSTELAVNQLLKS